LFKEEGKVMKHTAANLNAEDNQRKCISADRALSQCYLCKSYPTCESKIVNEEFERATRVLTELKAKHNAEIEAFNRRWSIR
jgi:hypothetical protein